MNAREWLIKADNLLRDGEHESALKAYDKAIEKDPKYFGARINKGFALLRLGKREEALKAYDGAIEIDPSNPITVGAWYNKGIVFLQLDRKEEALEAFDEAISVNPHFIQSWIDKGVALWSTWQS